MVRRNAPVASPSPRRTAVATSPESCVNAPGSEKTMTFERVDATTLRASDGRTFRTIRAKAAVR